MPLLLQPPEKPKPRDREAEGLQAVYRYSCAGALADLYTRHEIALFVRTQIQPDRRRLPEPWRRRTA
jgi:hypothetical protein